MKALKFVFEVMNENGQFCMLEMNSSERLEENMELPMATMFYTISLFNCLPLSLNSPNSAGLGTLPSPSTFFTILQEAGFQRTKINFHTIPGEPNRKMWICTK